MNKCRCYNLQKSAFTNYRTTGVFLFRQKRNLITSFQNIVILIPRQNLCLHHLKYLHCFQLRIVYHLILDSTLFINLFVVAVKMITLVERSDIYQLGLKNYELCSICVQVSMVSNQTMVKVHTSECNQFLVTILRSPFIFLQYTLFF